MKKNNKHYLIILVLFFSILFFFSKSSANENVNFLSLKNNKVNLRQGPSFEYPIKLTYKKKYLPILILGKSETWRKIKDFESNSGWIHVSQLSKKKSAINKKNNSVLYKKPTIYSKPIAKLEIGRLVLIKKCQTKWCKITSGGFKGWVFKGSLWGKLK
jgi:SH3-like domain-containing protein